MIIDSKTENELIEEYKELKNSLSFRQITRSIASLAIVVFIFLMFKNYEINEPYLLLVSAFVELSFLSLYFIQSKLYIKTCDKRIEEGESISDVKDHSIIILKAWVIAIFTLSSIALLLQFKVVLSTIIAVAGILIFLQYKTRKLLVKYRSIRSLVFVLIWILYTVLAVYIITTIGV